ncbi:MAG: HAMP domain-containing protein, partial [Chloroflexi bacterium]|nr:HAMP domain-containing protein [Chloroflexota bacterium]
MASQIKVDPASAGVEVEPAAASDLPRFTGVLRPLVDRVARAKVGVHAKLLVAFLLGTLLVMLLSILCLTILARLAGHVDDLARLQQKVETSQQLEYLVTLQSHLRAMALLTRDDSNNQKLENAKNDFRVRLETLQRLGGSDYSDLIRSVQATDQRFGIAGSRVLDAYRAANLDEAIRVHLREEHAISHELEAAMQQLQRDTVREMMTSHAAFLADRGVLRLVVILSSLLALVGAVISGFVFSFAFIIPIRKMKAALTGLAGGDFSQRVTIINNDEFGALGDSLNITSHRLSKLYGDLQELNQEFQDKNLLLVIEGQKRTQRTRVLVEVMRSLSSEFDLDRLLDKIMSCMTTVMQADRSTIFILDA